MKSSYSISKRISNLLPLYFSCLDHESSAANSHQNVLLTLEVGLLGIQYLSKDDMSNFWILATVGIALCFLIGPLYEYRINNVDYWRKEILSLIKGTPLEKNFYEGGYGRYVLGSLGKKYNRLIGHWFSALFIPLIILAWFIALMYNPPTIPFLEQIFDYPWILLFLCETTWMGTIMYLRSVRGT